MSDCEFPCSVCKKTVKDCQNAVLCDTCSNWVHTRCNKLDKKGHDYHIKHPDASFTCISCLVEHIPFSTLDNNQFNLYVKLGVNYITNDLNIHYAPRVRDQKLFIEVNKTMYNSIYNINSGINDDDGDGGDDDGTDDDDDDVKVNMNCKYYGTEDFSKAKFKENKTFSMFHLNIHSIERHIEELKVYYR